MHCRRIHVITKSGRLEWRTLRQSNIDPRYQEGDKIPGVGRVMDIRPVRRGADGPEQ